MYYCYVFCLNFLRLISALNVYQSSLTLTEAQNQLSGLYFLNTAQPSKYSNSLSTCIRFNYKRLGSGNEARVFAFDWPGSARNLLYFYARYPHTWMSLGLYENSTAFGGYIIGESDKYIVWAPQRWHHICLSYDKQTAKISLVKVSVKIGDMFLRLCTR